MTSSTADNPKNIDQKSVKYCDLVMKGGIASGVVYPSAILKLKEEGYTFKHIGGTSVGAIAAAATAAAEYGCRDQQGEGFDYFRKRTEDFLSKYLKNTRITNLRSLFQPSHETKQLFDIFNKSRKMRFFDIVILALRMYFSQRKILKILRSHYWGLCTGIGGIAPVKDDQCPALTEWLHDIIQRCSGIANHTGEHHPLTFGDLEQKGLLLRMVTSNLNHNQPYLLPFEDKYFLFRENDFKLFFPESVINYMVQKSDHEYKEKDNLPDIKDLPGYYFLPIGEDMPIVVAARMSMSFPLLFSMIPLYSIDASIIKSNLDSGKQEKLRITQQDLQLNLFSDGGIASNFPIHFFDAPIPGYPTFGIDLVSKEKTDEFSYVPTNIDVNSYIHPGNCVYLPKPEHIPYPIWRDLVNKNLSLWEVLFKLAYNGIFPTSQNYRDTMQSRLPSYRERIVQVYLDEDEGGLSLDMSPQAIEKLQVKGGCAGKKLSDFAQHEFKHHQWIRIKIMMGLLEKGLQEIHSVVKECKFDYARLANEQRDQGNGFPYCEIDDSWCYKSQREVDALSNLMREFQELAKEKPEGFASRKPLSDEKQILLRVTPEL